MDDMMREKRNEFKAFEQTLCGAPLRMDVAAVSGILGS